MIRSIRSTKRSKLLWYALLAIVIASDIVILARYHNFGAYLSPLRIERGVKIALTTALLVAIGGGLFKFWRLRNQEISPGLQRRRLMLAWCRGALRGGLLASLTMPLLIYEEDDGPRLIIFTFNILFGCPH
jgi:hypothetical protein